MAAKQSLSLVDTTDYIASNEKLRVLAAALENIEDAIVITKSLPQTNKPKICYTNPCFTRLTGWSRQEAYGRGLEILFGPSPSDNLWQINNGISQNNGHYQIQTKTYTSQGTAFISQWTISSIENKSSEATASLLVIKDLSQHHSLEEKLLQVQKAEAAGQLACGIVHDFNNLLTIINAYADLLAAKLSSESSLQKYALNIRMAGQRGANLVSRLTAFSRTRAVRLTAGSLITIAERVKQMLRSIIPETIGLTTHYGKAISPVRIDTTQVEQLLINLCVNARDAITGQGAIHVRIDNVSVGADYPLTATRDNIIPGDYVRLAVEDTGSGISPAMIPNIFDAFVSTKQTDKGTGLGLASAYTIMKQCQGYIDIKSELGHGSHFYLYFPVCQTEVPAALPVTNNTSPFLGSENVLIIEDDPTCAACITGLIAMYGYHTLSANSGLEAIKNYEGQAQDIQLLITDIILPEMTGHEVAAFFRAKNPDIQVIFMSGYDNQLCKVQQKEGYNILKKPFQLDTLLTQVRVMLDRKSAISVA